MNRDPTYFPCKVAGVFLIILSTLVIQSCGKLSTASPTVQLTTQPGPSTWIARWLEKTACLPPCWEGVTPGTTLITETVDILALIPEIDQESVKGPLEMFGDWHVSWRFQHSQSSGAILAKENNLIVRVTLSFDALERLTVDTIASSYGDPTHVIVRPTELGNYAEVYLINVSSGMVVSLYLPTEGHASVRVTGEAEAGIITFIPPGYDSLISVWGLSPTSVPTDLKEWKGYGIYNQ